jgi:hypothetical protein
VRPVGQGVDQQDAGERHQRHLAAEHQQPPVEVVGQRAADERHEQQWHQLAHAEQPDQQRIVGDDRHLVRDGDVGDERAEPRHTGRREHQPEVPGGA